jgi:diketogulonate reductase-like aldo/keto reductase
MTCHMVTPKPFSKTGLSVPEVGLGTWNYSGGAEPLRAGFDAGALFVDTAESYGSESVVGDAIAGLRDRVFVATKVSPAHFRFADVIAAADASLLRLKTDHIDLYQLHEPNSEVPIEETMSAMEQLVDAGKVRFIGVSNFSVNETTQAKAALRKHPLVSNQVRYSIIDRTIDRGLLAYCQKNDITVIAYSPLGRELQRLYDSDPDRVLPEVARAANKTIPQVALNWCLCKDGVVVIPKGSSVDHVLENCGASGWRLAPEFIQQLNNGVRFRQRGALDRFLRKALPRQVGPLIKNMLKSLPAGLRRRLT